MVVLSKESDIISQVLPVIPISDHYQEALDNTGPFGYNWDVVVSSN